MSEARALEVVESSALVAQQNAGIVRAAPGDVAQSFGDYRRIQQQLDALMPDCIQVIQGKPFRKKSFWRAIATAFNLDLEQVREERVEIDGDWGYLVTYRATAPNGRKADGDGSCMASEKGRGQASLHNVRAHAHTRAMNRAISNLVGFGEVSAEEMHDGDRAGAPQQRREVPADARSRGASATPPPASGGRTINEKQSRLVWARTMSKADALGIAQDLAEKRLRLEVADIGGVESSRDFPAAKLDELLERIESWTLADFGAGEPPADDVAF